MDERQMRILGERAKAEGIDLAEAMAIAADAQGFHGLDNRQRRQREALAVFANLVMDLTKALETRGG